MPTADDEMSIREIARTIADFRQEFRSQIGQLLRADVYRAEQAAFELRIVSLEKDRDASEQNAANTRRIAIGAVLTGVITVVVGLLLVALKG
jgi:hypothetical protein